MSGNEILGAAEQAKQQNGMGNSFSLNRRWEEAIEASFKAITLCPQIPSYLINRALCYYKRENWVMMQEDCRRAIHLDSTIAEVRHMLGVALLRRREYDEGIRELEKALDLARAIYPNSNEVKRIRCELAREKYSRWAIAACKKSQKLCNLREACMSALKEKNPQVEGFMDEVEAASSQLEAVEDVFRKAAEADMLTEVPDYLCCAITLDLLQDPVITPYGHTYEKEAIIRHLERNNFDPITQRPLDRTQLVPNWAVKKAVQAFLDNHGWAYKELREACVSALKEKNAQVEGFMDEVKAASSQLEALEDVFCKAAEADMPTEVPDYLRCAITLGLLRDPVITPYGHTYEKEAIIRHLERNNFDPITQGPLDRTQLVPNWAVKKAIQAFLDNHGWAYKELREACVPALKEKNAQVEGFMDEVEAASSQLKAVEDVFFKAAVADMPAEVPDYLCCAITLDLLQDPVITPHGHTYEKEAIIRHLKRKNFDPMTRRPLDRSQLVPNLAVKKAVQAFLDKHGWAYKEFIGDDDESLKLSAKRRKVE